MMPHKLPPTKKSFIQDVIHDVEAACLEPYENLSMEEKADRDSFMKAIGAPRIAEDIRKPKAKVTPKVNILVPRKKVKMDPPADFELATTIVCKDFDSIEVELLVAEVRALTEELKKKATEWKQMTARLDGIETDIKDLF